LTTEDGVFRGVRAEKLQEGTGELEEYTRSTEEYNEYRRVQGSTKEYEGVQRSSGVVQLKSE
jgi:hypothetical protein